MVRGLVAGGGPYPCSSRSAGWWPAAGARALPMQQQERGLVAGGRLRRTLPLQQQERGLPCMPQQELGESNVSYRFQIAMSPKKSQPDKGSSPRGGVNTNL